MPRKNNRPTTSPAQPPVPPAGIQIPPAAHAVLALLDPLGGTTTADLAERAGLGRSTVTKALAALVEAGLAVRKPGGHDGARRIADLWFSSTLTAASTDRPEAADTVPDSPDQPDEIASPVEDAADAAPSAEAPEATADEAEPDAAGEESVDQGETIAEPGPVSDGGGQVIEPGTDEDTTGGDSPGEPDQADADQGSAGGAAGVEAAQEQAQSAKDPGTTDSARLGKGELRDLVERYLREHPDQTWTPSAIAKVLGRSAGAIKNACEKLVALGSAITFEDAPSRFQYSGSR